MNPTHSETVAENPLPLGIQATPLLDPCIRFLRMADARNRPQATVFSLREGGPFSFVGLWECWHDSQGEVIHSCTIRTTTANEVMRPIHERMPVLLGPFAKEQWLHPRASADALRSLLTPYIGDEMETRPVG